MSSPVDPGAIIAGKYHVETGPRGDGREEALAHRRPLLKDTFMHRMPLAAALFISSLALCPPARAGDAATAEALFRDGRRLMEAGDFAAACPKLAASFAEDPGTGTLLALATCQEQAGQTASAWANYAEVAARAKRDGRADREEAARERMRGLEAKLSRLTIQVDAAAAGIPGLTVKRDGTPVSSATWGTGVPLDPGDHVVEASAPGKAPWTTTVSVAREGDQQTVTIPALEDEASAPPAKEPAPADAAEDRSVEPEPSSEGPPLRTIGLIVGGVGLVGLGVGGFFGLRAKSLNDESKEDDHCNAENRCDAVGGAKRDDAQSAAGIATVAFIGGGVLAAAGVTLFLVGGPKETESARVEAMPAIGAREAGMVVRGRF